MYSHVRVEIFKNAGLSFICKRRFSNTSWRHASYTNSTMHALWGMLSYFHRFVDWRKRFEYATCGRVFFRKRKGKKISVFNRRGLKLFLFCRFRCRDRRRWLSSLIRSENFPNRTDVVDTEIRCVSYLKAKSDFSASKYYLILWKTERILNFGKFWIYKFFFFSQIDTQLLIKSKNLYKPDALPTLIV